VRHVHSAAHLKYHLATVAYSHLNKWRDTTNCEVINPRKERRITTICTNRTNVRLGQSQRCSMKFNRIAVIVSLILGPAISAAVAHEGQYFSAGEPGDQKLPSRTVNVIMREDGKKMLFEPNHIIIRRGEQIRFVLFNEGTESHEFVLATVGENRKHAELMKKHPHMMHDDPNAKRLTPFVEGEFLWKFSRRGTFEYACLIPGHYEAGMHGTIGVK